VTAPVSMALAANAMPVGRSGARSAVTRTAVALRRTMSRRGAFFAGEDGGEDGCVGAGVAAAESFDGGAGEADVFGGEGVFGDDAVVDFGEVAGAGDGELVYTLLAGGVTSFSCVAVDDEGVAGVEEDHGVGGEGDEMRRVDAHDLRGGSAGLESGPTR